MSSRFDLLIIGGGMAGSATALAMADSGRRVAVVEPAPMPIFDRQERDLRVVALSPASCNLLRQLKVWETITGLRCNAFTRMRVEGGAKDEVVEFDASDINHPALGFIVENSVLVHALRTRAQSHDHIVWHETRAKAISVETDDVIAQLESGGVLLADLVVGADGVNSWLRESQNIQTRNEDYQQRALVAYVQSEFARRDLAWQRFLPDSILALLPCAQGLSSMVWSMPQENCQRLQNRSSERFDAQLSEAAGDYAGALKVVSDLASFPLHGMQAEDYVRARVALVGDAAHSIHPLAGQGANLAFLDVAELVRVLVESDRDPGSLHVLRKYARRRAGENQLMQRGMEFLQQFYHSTGQASSTIRVAGLGLVRSLPPLRRVFIKQAVGMVGNPPPLILPPKN